METTEFFEEIGNEFDKTKADSIHVNDGESIRGFFKDFRFLSNFYDSPVYYEGELYRCSEGAYQAAKLKPEFRSHLTEANGKEAKRNWKKFADDEGLYDNSSEEWDSRKYDVMAAIVFDKFYRNILLREKLVATGDKYLEETNWWRDFAWGVCKGKGTNWLGKILMNTREFWKNKPS